MHWPTPKQEVVIPMHWMLNFMISSWNGSTSIGLVSSRSWKIEIALISQTSSLNWKLTQMSSTFPQVFNLKLRKYVVHTLLINRYASSVAAPNVSRKIDWQIEIKKFVKSVKKTRSDSQFFFQTVLCRMTFLSAHAHFSLSQKSRTHSCPFRASQSFVVRNGFDAKYTL